MIKKMLKEEGREDNPGKVAREGWNGCHFKYSSQGKSS